MAMLSIIVPVFNKVEYIDSCMQSILSQSFNDIEVILINDGSTDGSGTKCDYYQKLDNRVKVFHQENKGVSSARNLGVNKSTGLYIGFVDSDDTIDQDMYEILVRNAANNKADISICSMKVIFPYKKQKYLETNKIKICDKDEALASLLKGEFYWSANNKIYKAEVAKEIKFVGSVNEDVLYNFSAFSEATTSVFQDTIKYSYVIRNNSVSMSKFNLKYMETIYTSKRILDIVSEKMSIHLEDAQALDFLKNISLLNLLLLSDRKQYSNEYRLVFNNLKNYASFIKTTNSIQRKHRYAYYIFEKSPTLYSFLMRIYCSISNSEVLKRT